MKRYLKMSYDIIEQGPVYPGTPPFSIQSVKSIRRGDSCNSCCVTLSNHGGTHIDGPRHFDDAGRCITDFSIEEFFFTKPVIISCPKKADEAIGISDIAGTPISADCDCILLKTCFSRYRHDGTAYCNHNPYLAQEAAQWIRETLIHVRAIGIDCISIGSSAHRDIGRRTHALLLQQQSFTRKPLCVIEDMFIAEHLTGLDELIALPIFITGVDSCFCTVVGIAND